MNVYDQAHGLAKAIRESEEFKQYDALKKQIEQTPEIAEAIRDFEKKQMELQTKQMMGESMEGDVQQTIQNLYQIIMRDPTAAAYMQAQMRFSLMMADVYKIMGEAVGITNPF